MLHTIFRGANNNRELWHGQCPLLTKGQEVKVEANEHWGTVEEVMVVWNARIMIAGSDVPWQLIHLDKIR